MSTYDDVYREALSDWLDVRRDLAADERPDRSEYEDAAAFDDEDGEFVAPSAPTRPSDPAGGETARFTTEEPRD